MSYSDTSDTSGIVSDACSVGSVSSEYQKLDPEHVGLMGLIRKALIFFRNHKTSYIAFEENLTNFMNHKIDLVGAVINFAHLFKKKPNYILDLNTIFNPDNEMELQMTGANFTFQVSMISPVLSPGASRLVPLIKGTGSTDHNKLNIEVLNTYTSCAYATPSQVETINQALIETRSDRLQFLNNPSKFNEAFNYLLKVKERFHNEPDNYDRFVKILTPYRIAQRAARRNQENMGINTPNCKKQLVDEIHKNMIILFENHADLMEEFEKFLPDMSELTGEFFKLTI